MCYNNIKGNNMKQKNVGTQIDYIKCDNCGSSNFSVDKNGIYRCTYCNSTVHIESSAKEEFIDFLNAFSTTNKRLHFIKATKSKQEFLKQAKIELSMDANSPTDILKATFGELESSYAYYVVFEYDFNFIKLSDSLVVGKDLSTGVKKSSYRVCLKIEENNENNPLCKLFLQDLDKTNSVVLSNQAMINKVSDFDLQVPDKSLVEKIIDKNINGFKEKIIQQTNRPDIAVIPLIRKIDLYIVPEYSVEYEYNGQKNKLVSFAYQTQTINQCSQNTLAKKIKKQSIIFNSIFYGVCGLAVLLALVHILFIRTQSLVYVDFAMAGLCVLVFLLTRFVSKKLIIKTKKKHFESKREATLDYLAKNDIKLTRQDYEIINNYLRWY